MDFKESMSYGDYLGLNQILTAQHPLSPNHNEMLFIIQHQTSELWIKLMLHELQAVREQIRKDELAPAFKMLARVARIMDQLVHAWDVLATMTPPEYTAIRPYLGASSASSPSSTASSNSSSGTRTPNMLAVHQVAPEHHALLERELHAPSRLRRGGDAAGAQRLPIRRRGWTPTGPSRPPHDESVQGGLAGGLPRPEQHWALYELAEKLVDLETAFRTWRFRHVTTVERIIGFKTGTGGTAGVSYLRKMLDVVLFPELFALRTVVTRWAASASPLNIAGALLVGPSDTDAPGYPDCTTGFQPMQLARLPFPSIVVASSDDPYVSPARARQFAQAWGSAYIEIANAGHINGDAGYGPWPEGERLLLDFCAHVQR
jgi:tryptophan 2,3-dioxygenase